MHFGVRGILPKPGAWATRDGYTTLEGFGIYDKNPNFMPFLDLRGHVFNSGKLAGNFGIGGRSVLSAGSITSQARLPLLRCASKKITTFTVNQLSPGIVIAGENGWNTG